MLREKNKVIYYREQVIQCRQCSYLLLNSQIGLQSNVIYSLEESNVYRNRDDTTTYIYKHDNF